MFVFSKCMLPLYAASHIVQLMVRKVDEKLVMKGVLPHLIKLARDSEM